MNPIGSHVGIIFETHRFKNEPERGSKKCYKKWYPPRLKQDPICRPGGSWRRSLARAFSTTETPIWTATVAITATIAKIAAHVQFLFEVVA